MIIPNYFAVFTYVKQYKDDNIRDAYIIGEKRKFVNNFGVLLFAVEQWSDQEDGLVTRGGAAVCAG